MRGEVVIDEVEKLEQAWYGLHSRDHEVLFLEAHALQTVLGHRDEDAIP